MEIVLALRARERGDREIGAVGDARHAHGGARRWNRRQHAEVRRKRARLAALRPDGNAVPPPQLARDAPVADVLVPHLEVLCVARGEEAQFAVARHRRPGRDRRRQRALDLVLRHRAQRRAAQAVVGHAHIPLVAEVRLDRHMRAVRVADRVAVRLRVLEEAVRLEPRDDLLARLFARQADECTRLGRDIHPAVAVADRAVGRHDIDRGERVALPDVPVVRVVRGRHLEEARRELRLRIGGVAAHRRGHHDIVVLDDRDLAADDREPQLLAAQRRRARVLRVDRDGGVAEHRLGARGRDRDMARAIRKRIAQVPEVPVDLLHLDLVVGERRLRDGVPVHEALAAVDEAVAEERAERVAHGRRAGLVHREARAVEVARAAHRLELPEDRGLVLVLPLLHLLDEPFAREVGALLPLEKEALLDDRLRGDARVVGAGHPQRVRALHAVVAREEVLQRVVEGVAEVERGRDIRRRDEDRVRLAGRRGLGMEAARGVPTRAHDAFGLRRHIGLRKFGGGRDGS